MEDHEGVSMETVANNSPAMLQIMKLLGMEGMAVIAFELHCAFNKQPTVDVRFYPKDVQPLPENEITQTFELIVKGP